MTTYGFLGMGIMGSAMAGNLVRAGFDVIVWNRSPEKTEPLVTLGARRAANPREVVAVSYITFSMVADPIATRDVCFGADGALAGAGPGHDYIETSTIDDATSEELAQAIRERGGRFLEAPVTGTKKPAEDGQLVFLAAGDPELFEAAQPAFDAMGKLSVYLGDVGSGARMKLVINSIMAGVMVALAEGLALAEESGLESAAVLELLDAGVVASPLFRAKGPQLLERSYPASFPLKHMQKDLRLALALGEAVGQPLHSTATINQTFKRAVVTGHGDEDFSAVFEVIR
jgi:3-hydroxyisobutyrate dehydrogenase-like beta-hydroxyacid dehydrogenase